MPPRRFCSLYPIHLYILLLLCRLDASGFCRAGLSRRFWLSRFLFWRLASTMVVGYRAQLSRFFRICMGILAVYFRDFGSLQGRQRKSTGRKSILDLSRRGGLYLNNSPITNPIGYTIGYPIGYTIGGVLAG